ncbi:unnamed protein product [Ceutorhynchus assimilis]|uniref:Uncharacterized protein n=1 Tax=Ceutorhynchus assimilis TaxID=467358 RepID=A0A9N9MDW6_9CUCU|nr:unnamed protein product [Ceutorhynchus assimilis]
MGTCFKCRNSCVYVDVTKDKSIKDLFGGPCDFCRNIFCKDCSKLTSSEIRALMTQSRVIVFFYQDCMANIKQIGNIQKDSEDIKLKFSALQQNVSNMKEDIQNLQSQVTSAPKSYAQALASTTSTLQKDISDIKNSAEFISQCYEDQKTELVKATETLKKYDTENSALKQNIKMLETKMFFSEQKEKENKVIISGLKQVSTANISETVKTVFRRLSLESLQYKQCYKLNNKDNSPILVELNNKQDRACLFKKRKDIGKISAESCGLHGGTIYFNEDLTMENQKLFKLARDARKQKLIGATYTYLGLVYVKKDANSPAVKILSEDNLKELY